jgi:DNA-nicking Smr family endonuclease
MPFKSFSECYMSKISDEERDLFRAAMSNVRPLKTAKRIYFSKKTKVPKIRSRNILEDDEKIFEPSDRQTPSVTTNQAISFARPGVHDSIFRKLQKGTLSISASLDLHGETQEAARTLLSQFIQHCYQNNQRYLRIVHGKGLSAKTAYPILKNQIYHWLPQFPQVLAFQSASPRDGGTGAVYVLLKARRE